MGARIGSAAEFTGALFKQKGQVQRRPDRRERLVRDPATFEGEADFVGARIGSAAEFSGAVFKQLAVFAAMKVEQDISFSGTSFEKNVSFINAHFGTAFFVPANSPEPTCSFQGTIDWRGCTYTGIHPASVWKGLMDRLDPYDRQPYTQLEGVFRRSGDDEEATKVYYRRKRVESKRLKLFQRRPFSHHVVRWLADQFLWVLTGYGVRLRRILVAALLILALGTVVFQYKGAVEPKREAQSTAAVGTSVGAEECDFWDGFWVSARHFLPVEIPAGSRWKPTSTFLWVVETRWGKVGMTFEAFATFLKLAGWILVPVGLAGLTGILKR